MKAPPVKKSKRVKVQLPSSPWGEIQGLPDRDPSDSWDLGVLAQFSTRALISLSLGGVPDLG